jgi:hypothetical protein
VNWRKYRVGVACAAQRAELVSRRRIVRCCACIRTSACSRQPARDALTCVSRRDHAAVTDAAAAAGIFAGEDDSDGAGPAAPTEADLALVANLKRVCDDEASLLEAARKACKRKWAPGEKPVLEFHIGPTGAGKSRTVMESYPDAFLWYTCNGGNSIWMDNYDGELIIVLDEFRGELPFNMAKVIFGYQPCTFQTKGGPTVQVLAKKFVFTSTAEPDQWYDDPAGEWARRVREFGVFVRYS